MTPADVTLSCLARATAARLGVDEPTIKRARAGSGHTYETPAFLVAVAVLPDGRQLRFQCRYDQPAHVVALHIARS